MQRHLFPDPERSQAFEPGKGGIAGSTVDRIALAEQEPSKIGTDLPRNANNQSDACAHSAVTQDTAIGDEPGSERPASSRKSCAPTKGTPHHGASCLCAE